VAAWVLKTKIPRGLSVDILNNTVDIVTFFFLGRGGGGERVRNLSAIPKII